MLLSVLPLIYAGRRGPLTVGTDRNAANGGGRRRVPINGPAGGGASFGTRLARARQNHSDSALRWLSGRT
jgi:hypothetical protein